MCVHLFWWDIRDNSVVNGLEYVTGTLGWGEEGTIGFFWLSCGVWGKKMNIWHIQLCIYIWQQLLWNEAHKHLNNVDLGLIFVIILRFLDFLIDYERKKINISSYGQSSNPAHTTAPPLGPTHGKSNNMLTNQSGIFDFGVKKTKTKFKKRITEKTSPERFSWYLLKVNNEDRNTKIDPYKEEQEQKKRTKFMTRVAFKPLLRHHIAVKSGRLEKIVVCTTSLEEL